MARLDICSRILILLGPLIRRFVLLRGVSVNVASILIIVLNQVDRLVSLRARVRFVDDPVVLNSNASLHSCCGVSVVLVVGSIGQVNHLPETPSDGGRLRWWFRVISWIRVRSIGIVGVIAGQATH